MIASKPSITADLLRDEQIESEVARQTRTLRSQVHELTDEAKELRQIVGFYSSVESASMKAPKWVLSADGKGEGVGVVVAQLTDCHFDEIVRPEEILELNAYNREIATQRLRRWAEQVITLSRDYVRGVKIQGVVVMATGDILSGDIHAELKQSNADHLYASTVFWTEQLISALRLLADELPSVHVVAVVGNHGRSTIKPVFKGRAHSNIEWLLWRVVQSRLAGDDRITFDVSDSMDQNVGVLGYRYLITHGDQFHGGSGIAAALSPLMLGQHRKTVRQMATDQPMDMMVMGHFHQLLTLPGLTVGGSMKGYDEYAFGMNLRPEPAAQALWISVPGRGPTIHMPVLLQDRVSEGW